MENGQKINIHYLAYEVDTHDSSKMEQIYAAVGGVPGGGLNDEQKQTHYFQFLVDHLSNIIHYQFAQGHIVPADPNRLTIFAAPEFYFKDRKNLPFNKAVFDNGRKYMSEKFNGFGNILIFPGSVWWWEQTQDAEGKLNAAIHNSVPIFYQNRNIHNWNKKFLSSIDGLGDPAKNWGPATHWDQRAQAAHPLYEGDKNPYFTVDVNHITVNVGIEVCLENCYSYLKQHNDGHLDVHMLVCAGIPRPDAGRLACRVGGVFLRCDGGNGAVVWSQGDPKAGQPMYNGNRSNCGTRAGGVPAIPMNVPSNAYNSIAARPATLDERVVIYNPIEVQGPS